MSIQQLKVNSKDTMNLALYATCRMIDAKAISDKYEKLRDVLHALSRDADRSYGLCDALESVKLEIKELSIRKNGDAFNDSDIEDQLQLLYKEEQQREKDIKNLNKSVRSLLKTHKEELDTIDAEMKAHKFEGSNA